MGLVLFADGSGHKAAELHIRLVVVAGEAYELRGLVDSVLSNCAVQLVHLDVVGLGCVEHSGFLGIVQQGLVGSVVFVNPFQDVYKVLLEVG